MINNITTAVIIDTTTSTIIIHFEHCSVLRAI